MMVIIKNDLPQDESMLNNIVVNIDKQAQKVLTLYSSYFL